MQAREISSLFPLLKIRDFYSWRDMMHFTSPIEILKLEYTV